MSGSHGIRIIMWIYLLTITEINGTIITHGPSNTVSEIGEKVKLECAAIAQIGYWYISKNGVTDEVTIVGPGCLTVRSAFVDHYAVEPLDEGTTCNLIVFNITMEQAGVYRCFDGSASLLSIVTVTESSPAMASNTTLNGVVENETVINSCSLNHNGSMPPAPTLRPYFYWTDSNGLSVFSSYNLTTENTSFSQLTITAGRQNITSYTCHVYMYLQLIPSTNPNYQYANNTPIVNKRAICPNAEVLYTPSPPVTTSRPGVITINGVQCGISVLTCSNSTGNPIPNYRWYDTAENVNILSTSNELTLAEVGRKYRCEAYNTIRNVVHNALANYTVSDANCGPTSAVQCCVFPRKETTSVTVKGCDNGTLCDCSQGNSGIILTCNSKTFPNASYMWKGPNGQEKFFPIFDQVTMNGVYRCTTYFNKASSNYTGNVTFQNATNETTVEKCYTNSDQIRTIILACVLGGYGLLNIIATIAFIVYYNRKSNNKERQAFTFKNKMTLNARFPWLQRMLPCMNESEGNAGCSFLWVLLFILMSVCAGIIVFPILVAMANCSGERNDAKDDTDIGTSNVYQEDTIDRRGASKSSTDAHGHVEAPYDEIRTMHPGRKVVLEESTSSNPKDAKKVFYTKVNPNFNAEEGVERYSVSLPS